jgi:hypothetical protein
MCTIQLNSLKKTITLSTTEVDLDEFVKYLESKFINCIAFGNVNNKIKMFLYALEVLIILHRNTQAHSFSQKYKLTS